MTTREKLNYLIEIGISIKTIARYSNYNETHISKYAKGIINISNRCELAILQGINQLITDLEVIKNGK